MQGPEQRILEVVPQLVAGRERIGKGVKREKRERLDVLDLVGESANDRRIIEVTPLRDVRHGKVVLDDQPKVVRRHAVQLESLCDPFGGFAAHQFVPAMAVRFPDVMQ